MSISGENLTAIPADQLSGPQDLTVTTPLTEESSGLYVTSDSLKRMALQHLKTLMLTIPGERTHLPYFGVGIKRILFEQDTDSLRADLSSNIKSQISKYIPYIGIIDIVLSPVSDNNALSVNISFYITYETSIYGPFLARWLSDSSEGDSAVSDASSGTGWEGRKNTSMERAEEVMEPISPITSAKVSSFTDSNKTSKRAKDAIAYLSTDTFKVVR